MTVPDYILYHISLHICRMKFCDSNMISRIGSGLYQWVRAGVGGHDGAFPQGFEPQKNGLDKVQFMKKIDKQLATGTTLIITMK